MVLRYYFSNLDLAMTVVTIILLTINAAVWADFAARLDMLVHDWQKRYEVSNIYASAGILFSAAIWLSFLMFFTRCTWGLYLIHGSDSMYFKEI